MTKKQYETNNRLSNIEAALMDRSISDKERSRLRQIQKALRDNLR